MNKENLRDYIIDAISYFNQEEHDINDRNNSIRLIDFAKDSIIVITNDNKKYLLNIVKLDNVIKNLSKMEELINMTDGILNEDKGEI